MIAYISGTIIHIFPNALLIVNQGVGYRVFCTTQVLSEVHVGGICELYTYHHVKEDAQQLFGFYTLEELTMYELLLSISGIGPKSALAVLSSASLTDIEMAVQNGDPKILTKVSGIGKKTAERVVLELKGKLGFSLSSDAQGATQSLDVDVIEALEQLGYSTLHAREALGSLQGQEYDSVDQKLKAALQYLSRA